MRVHARTACILHPIPRASLCALLCRLHVKGRDCGDTTCQYHLHLRHCGGQWIKIKEPEGYGDRQRRKGRNAGGERAPHRGARWRGPRSRQSVIRNTRLLCSLGRQIPHAVLTARSVCCCILSFLAGNGGSAEQGGSASGGGEARADGAPVPAKRPKKAGGIGSGGRPITDFFPSAGPSSPPMSTSQGSSERGANPSVGAAAAAAAASGRAGGVAVLPAIQEVQQAQHAQRTEERHSYQQQQQLGGQQEQQAPQQACRQQLQAEPPPEERRRLLAEAALRRLQRVQEPVALLPQQQPMEQQRQAEQQLQVGQLPAPPTRQQRQRQVPEGASLPAGSPGFVDLAGSDGEGGGLPRRMPQHWQQQQQGARGATSWAADGTAASSARGARMRVVGSSPVPRAAASAAGSAPKELAVGDAGAGAACPVCGKRWPPAAELGSAALNAELNAHIDECLTLSALAE